MKEKVSNYILSRDGLKLYYTLSQVENPVAVLCIFHGHGEHLGRFAHLVDYLNELGISCLSLDWRGHGHSDGKRGHIPSINHALDDIEETMKLARLTHLEVPLFLYGHSFGGCMVINYVLRRPTMELSGFIAASPWLALALEAPAWKIKLGNMMSELMPKFSQATDLDPGQLSRDETVVKVYQQDPLVHNRISAKFFTEVSAAGQYVSEFQGEVPIRGLVYHGSGDQIISYKATQQFAENHQELEFHDFQGFYHEPHNDLGKENVLKLVGDWIIQSIKSAS